MKIFDIIQGVNTYLKEHNSTDFLIAKELLLPHKTIKMFKELTVEVYLHTSLGNNKLGEVKVIKPVLNDNTDEIYKAAATELIAWLIENKDLYINYGTK